MHDHSPHSDLPGPCSPGRHRGQRRGHRPYRVRLPPRVRRRLTMETDERAAGVWTVDHALGHELVTVVFRDDQQRRYEIRIGSLLTPITLAIEISPDTGYVRCTQSHTLVTSASASHQAARYRAARAANVRTCPGFALSRILDAMTKEYSAAQAAGHAPDEGWLVTWCQ